MLIDLTREIAGMDQFNTDLNKFTWNDFVKGVQKAISDGEKARKEVQELAEKETV